MPSKRSGPSAGRAAPGEGSPATAPWFRRGLMATVFVAGAAVMVVEILGTRVIGPVFGVSLFVWSALLAVTLAALATGYYVGGVLADRRPERRLLGVVLLAAGALLALAPLAARPILALAEGAGPRGGSLLAATLLFGPCLAVMGMVGPVTVRLLTDDLRATGHRVGSVYAMSTAGSLVGTLLTGFVLVPALDTAHILIGTAAALVLAGGALLAAGGRPAALAALLLPGLALAAAGSPPSPPPGIRILERTHGPYGLVEVIEDESRGMRLLRADHSIIGGHWTADRSAVFAFLHLLESVRFVRPQATRLLQIGLGIGSLPMALRPYGVKSDVVEIDPEVVRLARAHFGFQDSGEMFIEDARTLLQRTPRRYDVIVHDTFTGGATPEHLLSVEVLQRIRAALDRGGLLALNFVGHHHGPRAEAAFAVARTLRAVFPQVRAFRESAPDQPGPAMANLVFFASEAPLDFAIPADARFENDVCATVLESFPRWEVLRDVPPGPPITDRRNPLARLQLPTADDHYAVMNRLLPPALWRSF
jgi:MFS family permease